MSRIKILTRKLDLLSTEIYTRQEVDLEQNLTERMLFST